MGQTLKFIPNPALGRFGDRAELVSMPPLEFINFAVWSTSGTGIAEVFTRRLTLVKKEDLVQHLKLSHIIPFSESSFDFYVDQITGGFPIDPPFLDMEVCGIGPFARPIGHEGRHRALAAYSLDIHQMPVYLFAYCNNGMTRVSQLTPQQREKIDFTLRAVAVS